MSEPVGIVITNLGLGYVFEVIRDYGGPISKSLSAILEDRVLMKKNFNKVVSAIKAFKKVCWDNALVTRNTNPDNLLLQEKSSQDTKLVLIDDWGSNSFIPIEYSSKILARKKLQRYWDKLAAFIERYESEDALKIASIWRYKSCRK
jgi:hypothetical protein